MVRLSQLSRPRHAATAGNRFAGPGALRDGALRQRNLDPLLAEGAIDDHADTDAVVHARGQARAARRSRAAAAAP
jgi:hypothetical protein